MEPVNARPTNAKNDISRVGPYYMSKKSCPFLYKPTNCIEMDKTSIGYSRNPQVNKGAILFFSYKSTAVVETELETCRMSKSVIRFSKFTSRLSLSQPLI